MTITSMITSPLATAAISAGGSDAIGTVTTMYYSYYYHHYYHQ